MPNWLTVLIGAGMTAAPMISGILPGKLGVIATAILGAATSIYHLYQPVPASK